MAPTPSEWLVRLEAELSSRQQHLALMNDYYTGAHPLPFLTRSHGAKMTSEFRTLLEDSRSNFMRLVVDVAEERLKVEGFRLSAEEDKAADKESWRIWQANQMDSESQTAFVEALVKGVSYLSVWSGADDEAFPSIAVEDASQTIVGYEPGSNFRRRAAALKIWRDDWTGNDRANVYMPNGIYKFERVASSADPEPVATVSGPENTFGGPMTPVTRIDTAAPQPSSWKELESEFVKNPVGVVPIIPLRNRPRLLIEGESELADVYRIQNQINGFLFLLALAGYFGAHKQRWAVGLTLMEDEQTGKPVEPFNIGVDKLIVSENPATQFGEFQQTDLAGYISAIEQKVTHIASTTRMPKHYLLPSGQEPSGDSLKGAESGLVKKVERKQRPFGEGLEEAIRLARKFAGEPDAPPDSEIVWASPQVRTEAEITDAAIKKLQANLIDHHQALEDCGYSPQQISRIMAATAAADPIVPSPAPVVA